MDSRKADKRKTCQRTVKLTPSVVRLRKTEEQITLQ